jgi:hypothetical protein
MKFTFAALAVLVCLAVASGPATAKSPPKSKYGCTIGGYYSGTMKIKGPDTYTRNGESGKYRAGDRKVPVPGYEDTGLKGYTIKFKTGAFKGMKGHWYTVDSGTAEIALENPIDGFVEIYCDEE